MPTTTIDSIGVISLNNVTADMKFDEFNILGIDSCRIDFLEKTIELS